MSERRLAWDQVVNKLENGLKNGKDYELSVIRNRLNTINKDCNFRNRDVKIFLINHLGNEIKFTYPSVVNKSVMVYSVPSNVLADHIRSVDPVQVCASLIRDALNDFDFGLDDRFCDAQDLKHALCDMSIPDPLLWFFGHLYNFNPQTYPAAAKALMTDEHLTDQDSDEEDDNATQSSQSDGELSVSRCRKIQSIFQILYYVHHSGRKRTPMHILNAESVHALGRGGKIVTQTLNHEGLAISYPELRRYQHDLASFTVENNQDRVALPSHFDPAQFTSVAMSRNMIQ